MVYHIINNRMVYHIINNRMVYHITNNRMVYHIINNRMVYHITNNRMVYHIINNRMVYHIINNRMVYHITNNRMVYHISCHHVFNSPLACTSYNYLFKKKRMTNSSQINRLTFVMCQLRQSRGNTNDTKQMTVLARNVMHVTSHLLNY